MRLEKEQEKCWFEPLCNSTCSDPLGALQLERSTGVRKWVELGAVGYIKIARPIPFFPDDTLACIVSLHSRNAQM
jgi:hypothetical protein